MKSTYIVISAIVVVVALIGYVVFARSNTTSTSTTNPNSQHVENDGHTDADHAATGAAHDDTGTAPHTD